MAAVDPYALCPCGSGEKFKWCCHKVEAFAERSRKLTEGGQLEQAIAALDEGLKKEPGNAWLLTRKALLLLDADRPDEAKEAVQSVLNKRPKHLGAQTLMTQLILTKEGPAAAAAQLQQALGAIPLVGRRTLAYLPKLVGAYFAESGDYPAALRHLKLALSMLPDDTEDTQAASTIRVIEHNPSIPVWSKNDDRLSPAPEALSGDVRTRFEQALAWAAEGLWSAAAAAFDTLSDDPVAGPRALRNVGFCRLWLADDEAAYDAFKRYAAGQGNTSEAVEIEGLCQQIQPPQPDDLVELVRLTWPLRDREALLKSLQADRTVHAEGPAPIETDEDAPEFEIFALLDREDLTPGEGGKWEDGGDSLRAERICLIHGRVYVGTDTAVLEALDDGRLDRLQERFTSLAGPSLAPAHPRTKVLGKVSIYGRSLQEEWLLPPGITERNASRLHHARVALLIQDRWINTPSPHLKGRTPLQAAKVPELTPALRASILSLETTQESWAHTVDFGALRARLELPPEPTLDPETVDPSTVHLVWLASIPADRLSDEKLVALYQRAREFDLVSVVEQAARALVNRPALLGNKGLKSVAVYADLANTSMARQDVAAARAWVAKGREAETPAVRMLNAPTWDLLELRFQVLTETPEVWVPELAVILDRYRGNTSANSVVLMGLVDLGLVEMSPHPERPGSVMLDMSRLEYLLSRFGPRVTTATGLLGVSAAKPDIWTPGSESAGSAGSGGIWTPGSSTGGGQGGGGGGEKKLIIPGR